MTWATVDTPRNRKEVMSVNLVALQEVRERETQSLDNMGEWTLVKRKLRERFQVVELDVQYKIPIYLLCGILSKFYITH